MIEGDGGGGDCGGGTGGEMSCGAPVEGAMDAAIVAPAPADAGIAYVGNYRVSRDGIVRIASATGKKAEPDAQD